MQERSHKKGETYQRDVKHWLRRASVLGLEAEFFGDAYDVTKKACTIGGFVFDFSLRLGQGELARHILYAECKYRNERTGNVNTDFREFLRRTHNALTAAETDEADGAIFVFLSNIPPDDWRAYLKNRPQFLRENVRRRSQDDVDETTVMKLSNVVHVLTLSATLVARQV